MLFITCHIKYFEYHKVLLENNWALKILSLLFNCIKATKCGAFIEWKKNFKNLHKKVCESDPRFGMSWISFRKIWRENLLRGTRRTRRESNWWNRFEALAQFHQPILNQNFRIYAQTELKCVGMNWVCLWVDFHFW